MSGTSYSIGCPKCGELLSLHIASDNKQYPKASGECLECGFSFRTVEEQLTLTEVNDLRHDMMWASKKSLRHQPTEWDKQNAPK